MRQPFTIQIQLSFSEYGDFIPITLVPRMTEALLYYLSTNRSMQQVSLNNRFCLFCTRSRELPFSSWKFWEMQRWKYLAQTLNTTWTTLDRRELYPIIQGSYTFWHIKFHDFPGFSMTFQCQIPGPFQRICELLMHENIHPYFQRKQERSGRTSN